MNIQISHGTAQGTFSLDGETHEVENNLWVIGNDDTCVIIDAPHDIAAISKLVAGREVLALLLTHAHDDHVRFAPEVAQKFAAPMLLHPADRELWALTHGELDWDADLEDGEEFTLAGHTIRVLHTPGHAPGGVCFLLTDDENEATPAHLFTGDTLFNGGPGATGRSYSDRSLLENSIREKIFSLPESTIVHTGHGEDTTVGVEKERAARDWL